LWNRVGRIVGELKEHQLMLRANDKGEKEFSEIRVAGEKFIHLL
jgi:hypothetical protein